MQGIGTNKYEIVQMKKIYFQLFKKSVFDRANKILIIRKDRMSRIEEAIAELHKWDDIPLSWQYNSICRILKIRNDAAAQNLIRALCSPLADKRKLASRLPYSKVS